jgi:aminoglycoside phosphotransferase family enzyme/predicted kinase
MADQSHFRDQQTLIRALRRVLERGAQPVQLFETHISWVLVAGPYAYKIKKAVRFDFLDFSTLAARLACCREELRLNRRLAPELYLEVVALTGEPAQPRLGGQGAPIEYAVKMRAFAQDGLWSRRIELGLLGAAEIDQLAYKLALFHAQVARAPPGREWGAPAILRRIADDNLGLIARLAPAGPQAEAVAALRRWQNERLAALQERFAARKAGGWVRECHGDLHSGNIFTAEGKVEVFDCIEFNDSLRWIDVMQDLAFICMDLRLHDCRALAARLLNAYLEQSGDYQALALHRYYQTECALVRWKIALVRAGQTDGAAQRDGAAPMAYALESIEPARPALILMHGFAGSGKSTVARQLVELLDALQIRSDVERKRMHGMAPATRAAAPPGAGLYRSTAIGAVYRRLRELAAALLAAGDSVVVDASFLRRAQRSEFARLAAENGVPWLIVDVQAREAVLRARIAVRQRQGGDASDAGEAVLGYQLAHHDRFDSDEMAHLLTIDADARFDPQAVRKACLALLAHGRLP